MMAYSVHLAQPLMSTIDIEEPPLLVLVQSILISARLRGRFRRLLPQLGMDQLRCSSRLSSLTEQLSEVGATALVATASSQALSRKIFIVHGHDDGSREAVARFLERIGFAPIILHEQANQGRTVIEKVVAHGDVGFAVVLLTPDDEGRTMGAESLEPRARQNVLLELGYFIGRLGRANVCALKRGELEIPSDFAGVV